VTPPPTPPSQAKIWWVKVLKYITTGPNRSPLSSDPFLHSSVQSFVAIRDVECRHFLWIAALQVDVDCFLASVQLGASDADYPAMKGPASRPILICFSYSSSVDIGLQEQRTRSGFFVRPLSCDISTCKPQQ